MLDLLEGGLFPAATGPGAGGPPASAACSILGYAFVPRIRDLPSKRLYVFDREGVPKLLRPLVGGKVNVDLIDRNWADILRVAASMAAGTLRPSQITGASRAALYSSGTYGLVLYRL